jgi:crotonobetainyl-CoA:carnitine CoA-transferase CaiB-like acyl-CoA transferase
MTPLEGIRVLDLTRVLAGPLCTMILGDLGAEVIKVERPDGGDDTRGWGPPYVDGDAAYFYSVNRNKRSVLLDLGDEQGRQAAREMALKSDVVVENFKAGAALKFGLDYESLRSANARLVYTSIRAFPAGGEKASAPGYDLIGQALTGHMSVTGQPGGEPTKMGVAIVDILTGMNAAIGTLAALQARERTGRGQQVEVSLFESGVAALINLAAGYLLGGIVPGPMGNWHPNVVPYGVFMAADRPFVLAAANDRFFQRTCEVVGRRDLARNPLFATNALRVENRERLLAPLAAAFKSAPAQHWLRLLEAAEVPCCLVRRVDEVFESPEGRRMVERVGEAALVAPPFRLSDTPTSIRLPPPRLGADTATVLSSLVVAPPSIASGEGDA